MSAAWNTLLPTGEALHVERLRACDQLQPNNVSLPSLPAEPQQKKGKLQALLGDVKAAQVTGEAESKISSRVQPQSGRRGRGRPPAQCSHCAVAPAGEGRAAVGSPCAGEQLLAGVLGSAASTTPFLLACRDRDRASLGLPAPGVEDRRWPSAPTLELPPDE